VCVDINLSISHCVTCLVFSLENETGNEISLLNLCSLMFVYFLKQ